MKLFKSLKNWIGSEARKTLVNGKTYSVFIEDTITEEIVVHNTIYINGFCTITFTDYDVISQSMTPTQYAELSILQTKQAVHVFLSMINGANIKRSFKENILTPEDLYVFINNGEFKVIGTKVYLIPCSLELPEVIVAAFIEILEKKNYTSNLDVEYRQVLDEHYEALKKFWLKASLGRNDTARTSLYSFITENDINITNTGNFIGFRNIVKVNKKSNDKLIHFVSTQFAKIKGQRKSPKNYEVFDDNSYIVIKSDKQNHNYNNHIGNLSELYYNLHSQKSNRYTDKHTGVYDIRIGATYKIDEKDLLLNSSGSCGGALHVSDGYNFTYESFGDTSVVCIINPMHMIKTETGCIGKCGVSQMFIAAVTTRDEKGRFNDLPDDELLYFDELYHDETLEELQNSVKNKDFGKFVEVTTKEVIDIAAILKSKVVENN